MLGLPEYLWRLIPANPILLRVVENGGKRWRDLLIRCAYLGLLVFFVIVALLTDRQTSQTSLTDLSNASRAIFRQMSYLQLALVALLAPIFTAGAITQERDSQTYDILLATPLSNAQIVIGALASRLFFVIALLVSGIPIFSVTQIFGGVSIENIAISFAIAASTAIVTGALAMGIATFKVGTRRTIFSFYLAIVIYLVGVYLLDRLDYFRVDGPVSAGGEPSAISWFTGIHPFLALRVILGDPTYQPPDAALLPAYARVWPLDWYLTRPASFYITFTLTLSVLLIAPAILLLRRLAQSSTNLRTAILAKLKIVRGDRSRKPRSVWTNPIAWREARTKGSAARATFIRWTFIICGIAAALVMTVMFATTPTMPPKYIAPGSFNRVNRTLFINNADTYGIADPVDIKLGDQSVDIETLSGKYEVVDFQTNLSRQNKTRQIVSIKLAPIARALSAERVRSLLLGAVVLEFAAILLIVTNAAASTVTREKEDGSLDLLLTTPITSRYYIWGKLRGLVAFVLPLVLVPIVSVFIFVIYDSIRRMASNDPHFQWIVFPEALLIMPPTLIIVSAFASIVGMQMSLRCRTTVRAVMSSVGIVAGICAVLVGCGSALIGQGRSDMGGVQFVLSGFSPFTLLALQIDPYTMADRTFGPAATGDESMARTLMIISGLAASGAYAAVVYATYKSMVKNFDMTIRRQSR